MRVEREIYCNRDRNGKERRESAARLVRWSASNTVLRRVGRTECERVMDPRSNAENWVNATVLYARVQVSMSVGDCTACGRTGRAIVCPAQRTARHVGQVATPMLPEQQGPITQLSVE